MGSQGSSGVEVGMFTLILSVFTRVCVTSYDDPSSGLLV